jgi:hypothetical protein
VGRLAIDSIRDSVLWHDAAMRPSSHDSSLCAASTTGDVSVSRINHVARASIPSSGMIPAGDIGSIRISHPCCAITLRLGGLWPAPLQIRNHRFNVSFVKLAHAAPVARRFRDVCHLLRVADDTSGDDRKAACFERLLQFTRSITSSNESCVNR